MEIHLLIDGDKTQSSSKCVKAPQRKQKCRCPMCFKIICSRKALHYHMKNIHKKPAQCEHLKCNIHFHSDNERRKHVRKMHPGDEGGKMCIFCGLQFINKSNMVSHTNKFHKGAIRCNFHTRCPKYFHEKHDKDEHVLKAHKTASLEKEVKCVYCGEMCSDRHSLKMHIILKHAAVSIKCRFNNCAVYFRNQTESDEHFCKENQQEDNLKKFQCPKCLFKTKEKDICLHTSKENTSETNCSATSAKPFFGPR